MKEELAKRQTAAPGEPHVVNARARSCSHLAPQVCARLGSLHCVSLPAGAEGVISLQVFLHSAELCY